MIRKYILVPYWKWCLSNNHNDIRKLAIAKLDISPLHREDHDLIQREIEELEFANNQLRRNIGND